MSSVHLETPKQVAARVGLSEGQVRRLIQSGQLEHVYIGARVHIPAGAFEKFLAERTVKSWADATKDRDCATSRSEEPTTSLGQSLAVAASVQRVRQITKRLKESSGNGSTSGDGNTGQVIQLKSS